MPAVGGDNATNYLINSCKTWIPKIYFDWDSYGWLSLFISNPSWWVSIPLSGARASSSLSSLSRCNYYPSVRPPNHGPFDRRLRGQLRTRVTGAGGHMGPRRPATRSAYLSYSTLWLIWKSGTVSTATMPQFTTACNWHHFNKLALCCHWHSLD